MEIENVALKNVSYLHARDPSILAWNRHGLDEVRVNLAKELLSDSNAVSNGNNEPENDQDYIKVFLRIKDGVDFKELYEFDSDKLICKVPEGSHALRNIREGNSMTKTYSFTKIFGPGTKQLEIFDSIVKPKVLGFINGKNSTLMTYGASGSGKTFTIIGTPEEPGVIPRALEYLFRTVPKLKETPKFMPLSNGENRRLDEQLIILDKMRKSTILTASHMDRSTHIKTYKQMQQRLSSETVGKIDDASNVSVSVWVSFAEIYNENIYDLLKSSPRGHLRPKLKLGQSNTCCYIKDLTTVNVTSGLEAYQILQYGLHNLNYAATSVNSHSSRSHCIFTMKLVQSSDLDDGVCVSTFNFCDLAGSERVKKTMNVGKRLQESNNINTSLLVLGRCISSIRSAQQRKDSRCIPFRESKLTQLFQRALAGFEDIMMIVNINPCKDMFDESQQALTFSALAKEILIEEQPKIVKPKKPNRFSRYIERKTFSIQSIDEESEEKDLELTKLKTAVADLYLELEQKRLEYQQELSDEREYIRSQYKEYVEEMRARFEEQKARAISKVKEEYEEKIQTIKDYYTQLLKEKADVISVDSSSEDEELNDSIKKNCNIKVIVSDHDAMETDRLKKIIKDLEETVTNQSNKIKLLEHDLVTFGNIKEKIPQLQEQLANVTRIKNEEISDLKITLEEAETAYSEKVRELEKLQNEYNKLMCEKLQLEDSNEHLELYISRNARDDSDECESNQCNGDP